jgi:hypothetical protein
MNKAIEAQDNDRQLRLSRCGRLQMRNVEARQLELIM